MPKKQVIGCAICRGSLPVESALHGLEERLVLPARGAGQAFRRRTRVRQHEQRRRAGILHRWHHRVSGATAFVALAIETRMNHGRRGHDARPARSSGSQHDRV